MHLHKYRLGPISEFLIYGHAQQRRAVIEALCLVENEYKDGQDKNQKFRKTIDDCNAQTFKEKLSVVHILSQSLCLLLLRFSQNITSPSNNNSACSNSSQSIYKEK